jgi:hypothetical protein
MAGRTKLGMGLTQTGSDEGGSTGRTSQQISNYSKRKRSPIYKKNPRGKIIKIGMLSGGQTKIAKKAPPFDKINAKDFEVLRAEKKSKDPKPMKAVLGTLALGAAGALGARKLLKKKKATATPGKGPIRMGIMGDLVEQKKKELMGKKIGGKVMKARVGKLVPLKKDPTKPISSVKPSAGGKGSGTTSNGSSKKKGDDFLKRRKQLMGIKQVVGKAGRLGAIGAAVAATAYGAKKLMDKIKEKKNKKMGGGLAAATERLRAQGKMGGGMMKRYNKGGGADTGKAGERTSKREVARDKMKRVLKGDVEGSMAPYKKMGGGMMKRPMGYTKGGGADTGTAGEARSKRGVAINKLTRAARDIPKNIGTQSAIKRLVNRIRGDIRDSSKTKMMGGGMMMRAPGYKKGKSVMAKGCKLGRKKPTKMY